jgi:hypothetical protein
MKFISAPSLSDFIDYRDCNPVITDWKKYPGYPDYRISPNGEVWTEKRNHLMATPFFDRYKQIGLRDGKRKKTFYIHRLVAKLYVRNPNPKKYKQVNHLDLDRGNNCFKNLRWTDARGNKLHALQLGAIPLGEKHPNSIFTNKQAIQIYNSKSSTKTLAKIYRVSESSINRLKRGSVWKTILKDLKNKTNGN